MRRGESCVEITAEIIGREKKELIGKTQRRGWHESQRYREGGRETAA